MGGVEDEKCENCRFWIKLQCRRYAPKMIVAGCGVGENPEYDNDWVTTKKDDWCGEYKKKK